MEIRLARNIQTDSIVDGEGIRTVIWTQGCIHNCKGCHNPDTHSFTEGFLIDIDKIKETLNNLEGQTGITFSGGDPMCQPNECAEIAKYAKKIGLNIWCYTGYTYERLLEMSKKEKKYMNFLKNIDVLVDGPFILSQKSFDVKFRGSKNQRIIDVVKSLKENKVIEKEDYDNKKNIIKRKTYI